MPEAEFYNSHRRWLRRLLHGTSEDAAGGADTGGPRAAAAPANGQGAEPGSPGGSACSPSSGGSGGGGGADSMVDGRFTDSFRAFHPARQGACTCWSTASSAR